MKITCESLAVEHPYYCSASNFYSNDASSEYETMTEFLDAYEDADIDMNLIFRWDVINRSESEDGRAAGRWRAEIFVIRQRKGIFAPIKINHINDHEAERFYNLAMKHWERLKEMWEPIAQWSEK